MRKFATIDNLGTSVVFYAILNGHNTPKAIAENIAVKPPSVVEQLDRLKKLRLVKAGKKQGKFQYYEADFDRLAQLFAMHAPYLNLAGELLKRKKEVASLQNSLISNELFVKMVKEFLRSMSQRHSATGYRYVHSLKDSIADFEKLLFVYIPLMYTREEEKEQGKLYQLLFKWNRVVLDAGIHVTDKSAFVDALGEIEIRFKGG